MVLLLIGLFLFIGVHSARIFAEGPRLAFINRFGDGVWKSAYTLLSIVGLVLIILGYRNAAPSAFVIWVPPFALVHIAALLMIFAFILVVAAYLPAGRLKPAVKHPMVLGVKVWAFAHVLINGMSHEIVLFGTFLVWAIADYAAARRRDRAMGLQYIAGPVRNDLLSIAGGAALWAGFVFAAHEWLFGIAPLG